MRENDQQHLDAICARNSIDIINRMQALHLIISSCKLGHTSPGQLLLFMKQSTSFGGLAVDPETGEQRRIIFIDDSEFGEDDHEPEYFCALHEIGHALLGHASPEKGKPEDRPMAEQVEQEIEAWEWALSHAQYFPNDAAICEMLNALGTYTDELANQERKNENISRTQSGS